jgi:nucleoid-associated protein YgaU
MPYFSAIGRRVIAITAAAAVAGLAAAAAAFAAAAPAVSAAPAAAAAAAPAAAAAAAPAAAAAAAPGAAIPRCSGNPDGLGLGVWVGIDQGNGAAGTVYYPLNFTNTSGRSCYLDGFPGVSAIDRNWRRLGSPAGWQAGPGFGARRTVILAPGATAHAVLAYHDAVVGTAPGCRPVNTTFELRVYPPDQRTFDAAMFGLPACAHAGPVYLDVGPVQPGPGGVSS